MVEADSEWKKKWSTMGSWGGRNHLMDGIDCSKGSKNCRHTESSRVFFVFSFFFLQNEEHLGTVNHKTWPNGRWVRNNNNYFFFSCFNEINHNLIVRKMFNGTRGGECLFYRWPGWCCWCVSCFVFFFFLFFIFRRCSGDATFGSPLDESRPVPWRARFPK